MKNVNKLSLLLAAAIIALGSCTKKQDTAVIIKGTDSSNDGFFCTNCNYSATGTIEQCPSDNNKWFINATIYKQPQGPSLTPVKTELLLPKNLPSAFKHNGITVKFDYNKLKDSTQLNCWFCSTPPIPYAQNISLCDIKKDTNVIIAYKPVIYLYPEKQTKVHVELNYKGRLTVTYPDFDKRKHGWEVIAQKDGTLKNIQDGREYQYLFWEGAHAIPYHFNMDEGFCVKGSETKSFLQQVLPLLGLTPREYNEMIVFWLPKMMNNNYNVIHFAGESYSESAPLNITPRPNTLIRVFMAYQASKVFVKTTIPKFTSIKRSGFTVVEWGGTEVNGNSLAQEKLF